jgi:hypothetical protein
MATFVDYSLPADPRTGQRQPRAAVRPQRTKQRLTKATNEELVRVVNELQDEIFDLVLFVTQLPFGGPLTYLKNVSFEADGSQILPHLIPVASTSTGSPGAPSNGVARAGSPSQIRFFVGNMTKPARFKVVSVDARNITIASDAQCIADILLMVSP